VAAVRALAVVLAVVGAVAGLAVGVVEHQRKHSCRGGLTFYLPSRPRYADYLPATRAPSWPGLAGYVGVVLAVGVVIAGVLLIFGFRLSRAPRTVDPASQAPS
jgi:hypothetical protein